MLDLVLDSLHYHFAPRADSFLEKVSNWVRHDLHHYPPRGITCVIGVLVRATIGNLVLALAAGADLLWWAGMLLTIKPVYDRGLECHIANLFSFLGVPIQMAALTFEGYGFTSSRRTFMSLKYYIGGNSNENRLVLEQLRDLSFNEASDLLAFILDKCVLDANYIRIICKLFDLNPKLSTPTAVRYPSAHLLSLCEHIDCVYDRHSYSDTLDAIRGFKRFTKFLIEKGADVNRHYYADERTPLWYILKSAWEVKYNEPDIHRWKGSLVQLLRDNGANLNEHVENQSPLSYILCQTHDNDSFDYNDRKGSSFKLGTTLFHHLNLIDATLAKMICYADTLKFEGKIGDKTVLQYCLDFLNEMTEDHISNFNEQALLFGKILLFLIDSAKACPSEILEQKVRDKLFLIAKRGDAEYLLLLIKWGFIPDVIKIPDDLIPPIRRRSVGEQVDALMGQVQSSFSLSAEERSQVIQAMGKQGISCIFSKITAKEEAEKEAQEATKKLDSEAYQKGIQERTIILKTAANEMICIDVLPIIASY